MEMEIDKELVNRNMNPFDLTEMDQWVNDATRKDLRNLARTGKIFGLKMWTWEIIDARDLMYAANFSVDLIFKKVDKKRILRIIDQYKNRTLDEMDVINKLSEIAIYHCLWV